jgi:hypothetical protein
MSAQDTRARAERLAGPHGGRRDRVEAIVKALKAKDAEVKLAHQRVVDLLDSWTVCGRRGACYLDDLCPACRVARDARAALAEAEAGHPTESPVASAGYVESQSVMEERPLDMTLDMTQREEELAHALEAKVEELRVTRELAARAIDAATKEARMWEDAAGELADEFVYERERATAWENQAEENKVEWYAAVKSMRDEVLRADEAVRANGGGR